MRQFLDGSGVVAKENEVVHERPARRPNLHTDEAVMMCPGLSPDRGFSIRLDDRHQGGIRRTYPRACRRKGTVGRASADRHPAVAALLRQGNRAFEHRSWLE